MNFLLVLAAVLLLVLYLYRTATWRPHNFPPGPPTLPLYGAYWLLLLVNYKFIHKAIDYMAHKYRTKVVGFYFGPFPTVVACDYESIKEVLTKPEFQGRMDSFVIRERQLNKLIGVFFVDGDYWKYQRRFMLRHLRDFGFDCRSVKQESLVQQDIKDMLDVLWGRKQEKDIFQDGYARVPDLFGYIFLNTFWDMFCGDSFTHNNHSLGRFLVSEGFRFHRSTDSTGAALSVTPWLRYFAPVKSGFLGMKITNDRMLQALQLSIDEHLATYSEDHMRDFIDVFIREMKKQNQNGRNTEFTIEQLLIIGLDLLLPTLTTVSATLGFAVQCLLSHPEVQNKLQQELDTVVGRDRLPTLDDRPRLPYIEATIREVMRWQPILPLGVAHRAMEDTYLSGYFVPKDTMVMTSLYSYHNDPEVWRDPRAFRPERFLDNTGRLLKKDLSLPFGAGKRLCAGETFSRQNMFLILAGLLQNFSFILPEGEKLPDMRPVPGLILTPREFWVKTIPRP